MIVSNGFPYNKHNSTILYLILQFDVFLTMHHSIDFFKLPI